MATGLEIGINLLEDIFFNSTFAGSSWIMFLTIIFASLIAITRDWSDWGTIALPVMVGWKYFGMPIPTIFMVVGTIVFVINILSMKLITGALSSVGDKITEYAAKGKYGRFKHRMDVQKEMEKIKVDYAYSKPEKERTLDEVASIVAYRGKKDQDEQELLEKEVELERKRKTLRERYGLINKGKKKVINIKEKFEESAYLNHYY